MRWVWENSHVDRLRTLPQRKGRLTGVVEDIRQTIEPRDFQFRPSESFRGSDLALFRRETR
jgi:hypothetical protein